MHINQRYFPAKPGIDFAALKLHAVGEYSISRPDDARDISIAMVRVLKQILRVNASSCVVIDGTACVGGNTLSFLDYFKRVVSIEIDPDTADLLKNNLQVYKVPSDRVTVICGDVLDHFRIPGAAVMFLDPPWTRGEGRYQDLSRVSLTLSGLQAHQLVKLMLGQGFIMVCVKVPFNFDIRAFIYALSGYLIVPQRVYNFYILICCNLGKQTKIR